MSSLSKNKGTILGAIIIILCMVAYNVFFSSDTASIPLPSEIEAVQTGEELRRMQSELQAVRLDRSLFSSQGFNYLEDYSLEVPQQETGRPNPFSVIGAN